MKIQQTVSEKFGKKFQKVSEAVTALDNQIIALGDVTQSDSEARYFAKEYKTFVKLSAKLAALVGE